MAAAQPMRTYPLPVGVKGKAFIIESHYAPFPDSLRNVQPRLYNGKTYSAAEHYNDSSVLVFIPDFMDNKKSCQFVHWFHGWNNNIDSSVKSFRLLEQFYRAGTNSIFIFPQGPKNAPDSYAGKWERKTYFLPFTAEWFFTLRDSVSQFIPLKRGRQLFAGHSGAYRIISKQLVYADDVLLFDGLYGELDRYMQFINQANQTKRFLHIYTDDGGTKENSLQFLKTLAEKGIPFLHKEEDEVTEEELKNNRIIFLHSKKGHNDVITNQRNFERFLRAFASDMAF